jgi:intermediate peptidase
MIKFFFANNKAKFLNFRRFSQNTGLFGLESIVKSNDFEVATLNAIKTIDTIRGILHKQENIEPKQSLVLLDAISNELCSVIDAAELCRNVHENVDFKISAENSFSLISNLIHKLNTDKIIYKRLIDIKNNIVVWQSLTIEEKMFVDELKNELEFEGIYLSSEKKEKSIELQGKIVVLETEFIKNISNEYHEFLLGPFDKKKDIKDFNLLRSFLLNNNIEQPPIKEINNSNNDENSLFLNVSNNKRIIGTLLKTIENPNLRKQLWFLTINQPMKNKKILIELIKNRHNLASLLGFKNYSEKFLKNKVATSSDFVFNILKNLKNSLSNVTKNELELLLRLKMEINSSKNYDITTNENEKIENNTFFTNFKNHFFEKKNNQKNNNEEKNFFNKKIENETIINPWDIPYLTSLYENKEIKKSKTLTKYTDLSIIKNYFSVSVCIQGLAFICDKVFGLKLIKEDMFESESWCVEENSNKENEKIQKYILYDDKIDKKIGTIYFDLYERFLSLLLFHIIIIIQ